MFNKLTPSQQETITSIYDNLCQENKDLLNEAVAKLLSEKTENERKVFVLDMITYIQQDRYLDDKDFYDENLNDILVEVLHFFCTMCHKHISKGDKIPVQLVRDLFIIATVSPIEQEWERMIANSLSYIPLTLAGVTGGENVSTALFTAIISTAFDYEMDW